ncbi:MAG TPA: helix-turn-helix transcriptional regulator [Gemmata sp.]|jgi:transcriptional regulator with XRE-family HTH domain|nr:helix-turn-helix transcriptional regulator [Gemmata sp.]
MNGVTVGPGSELANKIARLVEERGWNQEDFARISQLNRHTVRQILHNGPKRRLRNTTVGQCAEALGLTVSELRNLPLDRLLPRMHGKPPADDEALKLLYERAALPDLVSWIERNRDRAAQLRPDEIQEILDLQTPGGPLEKLGVENFVELIERRRMLVCRVKEIAGTEYIELLEQLVQLIFDKVKPRRA